MAGRRTAGRWLCLAALAALAGCSARGAPAKDLALAARIDRIVDMLLTSDDDARERAAASEAREIFSERGIPTVAQVGDAASYGFVLVNMLGQSPAFQKQFLESVRKAAARRELPGDAVTFAEAHGRQTATKEKFAGQAPSDPALRERISRLFDQDQAVRRKEGFDREKMQAVDLETAAPLEAIFDRYGVPTYDMVGVEAANDFLVMVQHQSAQLRRTVLARAKTNVDAGQADPGTYAMVYDRSQRDLGRNQLYGSQLECATGKALAVAPIDDEANVNRRRAELGLMRLEMYAQVVRVTSPDLCAASPR